MFTIDGQVGTSTRGTSETPSKNTIFYTREVCQVGSANHVDCGDLHKCKIEDQAAAYPGRVLACVRCQKRKIKCDRTFPYVNCRQSDSQCVLASIIPRAARKRRFPECRLLDWIHIYEDLLLRNNTRFELLHKASDGESELSDTRPVNGIGEDLESISVSPSATKIELESV